MKRLLTACLAITLLTTGCSKHVDPPPADADSIEVLRVFLDAIIADDEETGKQIAGPCWYKVEKWFSNTDEAILRYEIADGQKPPSPGPHEIKSVAVVFVYWDKSGKRHGDMAGFLERDGDGSSWRVCGLSYEYAP